MCTFDFSIDGNTGNSQYESSLVETTTNASMSSTDHHFATSWGGSSTTSVEGQVSDLVSYANASASVTVGRTNTSATDNISGTYSSNTQTSTFSTGFDDTVVYMNATENVYRYPMLGQICSPSGGNNGCTAERTGLQYYTMSIPNQPTITKSQGKVLEWFQPPWIPGNLFTYPANCASLAGMYGSQTTIDNPLKTPENDIAGGDGSFLQEFKSSTGNTTKTATGHSIFNDDTVSVTVGAGCVEKPEGTGAKVTETGNFQDTRDRSTLTSSTTTTSGSSAVETTWTEVLAWMQPDQFAYSTQFILNGLSSNFASSQIQSISTDPVQGADSSDTYVTGGFFSSAYTVTFDEGSEWWLDTNKADYYAKNIDVSLALPTRLQNVPGGTQTGQGNEPLTQCMDNGGSQKLQCVRMSYVDTSFSDVWGVCGDYFHMRGFFFTPAPSATVSSMQACSTQSDCPYGEACVSGTCGQCTQSSDCTAGGTTEQTCANNTCVTFVNGLPSVPGGTADTILDGTEVLLGVRVYNTSFMDMDEDYTVKVQIYGQEWDGEARATDATGNPVDSFLVGNDTIELAPIQGFPTSSEVQDSCDVDDAVFNWSGAFTSWDTAGFAGQEPKTYVFWMLAWAEDSSGNVVGELPGLGLCPSGGGGAGGAGTRCTPCPIDLQTGEPKCTWMTDVELDTWSNNLGLYRKVFTVLPSTTAEPLASDEVRHGGLWIDKLDIEGVRRVGEPLLVRARLRAQDGPVNTVSVTFFDKDPAIGEAIDQEIAPYIPEDKRWPVSISYRPSECGSQRIYVEAHDDQGFVTRGSRSFDVPCEEARVDATRQIDAGVIPREGTWTNAQLVLSLEEPLEVALPSATLTLERVLWTEWGEELVRTSAGDGLNGMVLTAVEHTSDDQVTYRGTSDGSEVEAIVTRQDDEVTIDLSLEGATIRPGLFCNRDDRQYLETRISLDDGAQTRALVTATDRWRCSDEQSLVQ